MRTATSATTPKPYGTYTTPPKTPSLSKPGNHCTSRSSPSAPSWGVCSAVRPPSLPHLHPNSRRNLLRHPRQKISRTTPLAHNLQLLPLLHCATCRIEYQQPSAPLDRLHPDRTRLWLPLRRDAHNRQRGLWCPRVIYQLGGYDNRCCHFGKHPESALWQGV